MNLIATLLYWISTGLLVPVVVGLLFLMLRAFALTGASWAEHMERLRLRRFLESSMERFEAGPTGAGRTAFDDFPKSRLALVPALERLLTTGSRARAEKVIADFELACDSDLARARTLVRIGPTLGLMGTLVPMGPALLGLARGDLAALAENLQVAFATTVLGLLVGGIGFLLLQRRQQWAAADANQIRYVYERMEESDAPV